jgi:Uma2 family endonuclease
MVAKLAEADQMTIEEFLAFTDARPDGERWELIEGVAVMNASPTDWHQRIVLNISGALDAARFTQGASWTPLLGIGTHVAVSPNSLPQPDVFIKAGPLTGRATTDDALVLLEVLSKSNAQADQAWRKRVYASVPNCQHYITVSAHTPNVVRYDRANAWAPVPLSGLTSTLELLAVGVSLPLSLIYRWIPIA